MWMATRAFWLCVTIAWPVHAEINGSYFFDSERGLELNFPAKWRLTEQVPYPGFLLLAVPPKDAVRLTVVYQETSRPLSNVVLENRTALSAIGFTIGSAGATQVDVLALRISLPGGEYELLQAYRFHEGIVYILTLGGAPKVLKKYESTFWNLVQGMKLMSRNSPSDQYNRSPL